MSFVKSEAAAAAAADRTSCAETSQAARRATGGRASSSRVDSSNFDDEHRILRNLKADLYRGANKGLHVLLSRTQAGPGRTVKQEQEQISRNHVQTFICLSVVFEFQAT